jgi:hypothetical protein
MEKVSILVTIFFPTGCAQVLNGFQESFQLHAHLQSGFLHIWIFALDFVSLGHQVVKIRPKKCLTIKLVSIQISNIVPAFSKSKSTHTTYVGLSKHLPHPK